MMCSQPAALPGMAAQALTPETGMTEGGYVVRILLSNCTASCR